MMPKTIPVLIALTLTASASTAFAQTLVFDWDHTAIGWPNPPMTVADGQLTISKACGRYDTNNAWATWAGAGQSLAISGPLQNNVTMEAHFDLVGASENDAWAGINFWWQTLNAGYTFWKDHDEVGLMKYYQSGNKCAWFFYRTNQPIKNENITMVFSLTRSDTNVRMDIRVLDKTANNAVLLEHTEIDTPQADPVLAMGVADPPGNPWPIISEPQYICPNLEWVNPEHAPAGGVAQVTFSDVQVWRYETPQLAIQNAVMLSWPATAAQFVLESAPSVTGPWTTVADPLIRTNTSQIEAGVIASQSAQLFRLKFTP